MRPRITFIGQAKSVMDFACPMDRDPSPEEEEVLDARDAALKVLLGVTPDTPGTAYEYSLKRRGRVWFEVRQGEILCFAIQVRDSATSSTYHDPLKNLNADQ